MSDESCQNKKKVIKNGIPSQCLLEIFIEDLKYNFMFY